MTDIDMKLLSQLENTWGEYLSARGRLFQQISDRKPIIIHLLEKRQRSLAYDLLCLLDEEELKALFPYILQEACDIGYTEKYRALVLSISKDWLLTHIENYGNELLESVATYQEVEYSLLFEIYRQLNKELAEKLASKALNHPDAEVRQTGVDLLKRL